MATAAGKEVPEAAELRQRIPHGAPTGDPSEERQPGAAASAGDTERAPPTSEKGQKTYGRTPDGTGKPPSVPNTFLHASVVCRGWLT